MNNGRIGAQASFSASRGKDFKTVSSLEGGSTTTEELNSPRVTDSHKTGNTTSLISSPNAKVVSSETLQEQRDLYIQQVQQTKEHLLSAFEKQKMILQSTDNASLLEKLEYLTQIFQIKITTYIGKFNNKVLYNSNLDKIFGKFQKEMSKISEMVSDTDKLNAIVLGDTFCEPPSDLRVYNKYRETLADPGNKKLQDEYLKMLNAYVEDHPNVTEAK